MNKTLYDDNGILVVEGFVQDVLGLDPVDIETRMTQEVPRVPKDEPIQHGRLQRPVADHPASQYRGGDLSREICILQDKRSLGLLRYQYTGAQWEMASGTADLNDSAVLAPIVNAIKDTLQLKDEPNHYIYTWYSKPSDKITPHRDGYLSAKTNHNPSLSPDCPIIVVRFGPGSRKFTVREHNPTGPPDEKNRPTKQIIWEGIVTSGTMISMTAKANRDYEHSVAAVTNEAGVDERPASSLVLRGIRTRLTARVEKNNLEKARKEKRKRQEEKQAKAEQALLEHALKVQKVA